MKTAATEKKVLVLIRLEIAKIKENISNFQLMQYPLLILEMLHPVAQ